MTLWKIDIEKVHLGEFWTNRYIVDANDLGAAHLIGGDIVEIEQTVHKSPVTFTKYRTSDMSVGTDIYTTTNINQPGLDANIVSYLPLFNVVRVDFSTVGSGRPSRKYLRVLIDEANQNNGVLVNDFIAFMNTNYASLMQGLQGFVDVDGQAISNGSTYPLVAMRQLRRGSKRRVEPVLP